MRIIIFGATGNVGRRTVREALSRGHAVTGVIRTKVEKDALPSGAVAQVGDAGSSESIAALIPGHDLVISAVRPAVGSEDHLVAMTGVILTVAAEAGARAIIVGGAARLKIPGEGGLTVLTKPGFLPSDVVDIARACQEQYEMVLTRQEAQWTYISPPAMMLPGERTGQYRFGDDQLVVDREGHSAISMEDFAVAIIDEAEQKNYARKAFTVAY